MSSIEDILQRVAGGEAELSRVGSELNRVMKANADGLSGMTEDHTQLRESLM